MRLRVNVWAKEKIAFHFGFVIYIFRFQIMINTYVPIL